MTRLVPLLVVLAPLGAWGWQDLSHDFVADQVRLIDDSRTPVGTRQARTWALASAGRAAVHPLAELAKKEPALLWTCVNLLDLIRTDYHVVEVFSQFLDQLPGGLADSGELRGFLSSRLEDMTGRKFFTAKERRAWVQQNAIHLRFAPATFRFVIDEEAKKKRKFMLHYPYAPSEHAAAELTYWKLVVALHLAQIDAVRTLIGREVKLVRDGRRLHTRPELDVDAFAGPVTEQRALTVRREGPNRWLVRSAHAYFTLEGDPARCVKAGLKPMD